MILPQKKAYEAALRLFFAFVQELNNSIKTMKRNS